MHRLLRLPLNWVALVWMGLAALVALDTWRHRNARRPGWIHHAAYHGGVDDQVVGEFAGGRLLAVTGGVQLDLRHAHLEEGSQLRVGALMGGVDIIVPETWRVDLQAAAFLGGAANHTEGSEDGPVLRVEAWALMGGVRVHTPEEIDAE